MKSGTLKWLIIGGIGAGIAWFLLGKPHSIQAAESGFENLLHGGTSHANFGRGWGGGFHGGWHPGWGRGWGGGWRGYAPWAAPWNPYFPQVPNFAPPIGPFGYGIPHHLGRRFV